MRSRSDVRGGSGRGGWRAPGRSLERITLPAGSALKAVYKKDLLGGVVVIRGRARHREERGWEGALYRPGAGRFEEGEILAVPYCVWDNRGSGEMRVWLRSV